MKSLYLRIWLTVVAALALFALVSGWMWHRHLDDERVRVEAAAADRLQAWAELVHRSLPAADAAVDEQAQALREWSQRLRVPLALDDATGRRIAASDSFLRRLAEGAPAVTSVRLDDGRTLWLARRTYRRLGPEVPAPDGSPPWRHSAAGEGPAGGPHEPTLPEGPGHDGEGALRPLRPLAQMGHGGSGGPGGPAMIGPGLRVIGLGESPPALPPLPFGLPRAVGPLVLVAMLFVAVAAGAYPVVRRLTRRLEALERGVDAFGHGDLSQRVDATGSDEVAKVATTFNRAAERIETLVRSHQSLLANASHELRSPLARLKMAVAMFGDLPEAARAPLRREIDTNIAELDALVEEVLLASRLDSAQALDLDDHIDLAGMAAEEAARVGADVQGVGSVALPGLRGSERLLRRALRNLLENARRYGGGDVQVQVQVHCAVGSDKPGAVEVQVCDRGPGVPPELRARIFEPFYRLPGHAEREGGVGLGLSLVQQIAQRHGGSVHCAPRLGGGSCFVLRVPVVGPPAPPGVSAPAGAWTARPSAPPAAAPPA